MFVGTGPRAEPNRIPGDAPLGYAGVAFRTLEGANWPKGSLFTCLTEAALLVTVRTVTVAI